MITAISSEKDKATVYLQRMRMMLSDARDERNSPRSYKTCMNLASINAGDYIIEKGLSIETLQTLINALCGVFDLDVSSENRKQIDALKEAVKSQKVAITEQRKLIELYKQRLGIPITDTRNSSASELTDDELPTFIPIPLIRRLL